jgi:16S rRNA pseudouridine516 synthase
MPERLDRWLSKAAGLTRSQAQRVIRAGDVLIDGTPVTDAASHVLPGATVAYRSEVLADPSVHRYFMLHKPVGVVCATQDREHQTVLDLLDVPNRRTLHVAGRLDIDVTGLVLITDDGDWSHRVTSPRHRLPKTYVVTLDAVLDPAAVEILRQGVQLRGEPKRCAPALVEGVGAAQLRLTITEGKYHQVKRMFAAVGHRVLKLHRERIGPVALDPELAPGRFRALSAVEQQALQSPAP